MGRIFNWFMKSLDNYYSKDEREEIKKLSGEFATYKDKKTREIEELKLQIVEAIEKNNILKQKIAQQEIENELEKYWNDKRPKVNIKYEARPIRNSDVRIPVDPRIFFMNDYFLPKIRGETNDEKAKNSLLWVINNIKYVSDQSQFKIPEMWLFAYETFKLKEGDCEDGAILMANIMIKAGIPYWRIRLNAGDVKDFGHVWVSYLRERDNQWVILDWCFYPTSKVKNLDKLYKDAEYYLSIWFSWNIKYIFQGEKLR